MLKGRKAMAKNLLREIEDKLPKFSKSQKIISKYILENYDKAAYMTASRLGSAVGVSESTVVRFALELGFEGYPEFQHSLQETVRIKLTSFQRMDVTNSLIGDGDLLSKVLNSDIDKIKRTIEEIDREAFDKSVDALVTAKNIYIVGLGSSAILASSLNHSLRMIFDSVRLIEASSADEIYAQIMNISPDDAVVAMSFPRYSKKLISAVNFAKDSGATVIALTDSVSSPIASFADNLLVARSDMASFADSLVAPMSIINALIVTIGKKKNEYIQRVFTELEAIWDEHDVYEKNNE